MTLSGTINCSIVNWLPPLPEVRVRLVLCRNYKRRLINQGAFREIGIIESPSGRSQSLLCCEAPDPARG